MSADDTLLVERRGATGWIVFNRPGSRNALTLTMYDRLAMACQELGDDPDIRVIGVRGAGSEAFAAGTDIAELTGIDSGIKGIAYEKRVEAALHQLEQVPKPTIALLQGAAVGGGAAIALACDIRIAADNLRFGVPIARTVGNCLSANNLHRLIEVVGPALTLDVIYTGRLIEAGEAMDVGLVHRVTPLVDAEPEANALAETLARHAPLTLHATKRMVGLIKSARRAQVSDREMDELVQRVYDSADFQEGISAFTEHRSPRWTGK